MTVKKLIRDYKVWMLIAISSFLMFVAVCIFSYSNYTTMNEYSKKINENSEQTEVVNRLNEENKKLKTQIEVKDSTNSIEKTVNNFINGYYNSDGTKTVNDKANAVKNYVTDDLYKLMYSENDYSEKPSEIKQQTTIDFTVCQKTDDFTANEMVVATTEFSYPDKTNDKSTMLILFVIDYDQENKIWQISSVSSSGGIRLNSIWR